MIKISQNIEKSRGDLRKLIVTQTLERKHQLTQVWKTLKRVEQHSKKYQIGKRQSTMAYMDTSLKIHIHP